MNGKVDRRALLASVGGAAAVLSGEMAMAAQPETQSLPPGAKRASDRLGFKYRFDDPDMDLFFVIACGWGRAGGLDIGEAYYVAQLIKDGDAESWVASFEASGDRQQKLADDWQAAGWKYQSAQVRLKAFASYRSAWQFAPIGPVFDGLYAKHKAAFPLGHPRSRLSRDVLRRAVPREVPPGSVRPECGPERRGRSPAGRR